MLRATLVSLALALGVSAAAAQPAPDLQPIQPQTALEEAFIEAFRSPAARPAFRQQFLESNVVLVTRTNAPDSAPRLTPVPGGQAAMIFTSSELLNRQLGPQAPRSSMTGRAALTRLRGQQVAINFGCEPMLLLDAEGIDGFLGIPATPDSAGPSQ